VWLVVESQMTEAGLVADCIADYVGPVASVKPAVGFHNHTLWKRGYEVGVTIGIVFDVSDAIFHES